MANTSTRKSGHRRFDVTSAEPGPSLVRHWLLGLLARLFLVAAGAALAVALLAGIVVFALNHVEPPAFGNASIGFAILPGPTDTPTPSPTATPPPPPEVAIIAGHWSQADPQGISTLHDTGALCPDGLREVDINYAVAKKTVGLLQGRGYRVDLLEEFDPRLKLDNPDYAPSVLLSIHSDSCVTGPDYPLATGYKIAHAEPSDNPVEDDRLVGCLTRDYQKAVDPFRLTFNADSITTDMTEYHAFREVVRATPAAIIELGFMGQDRAVLTGRQDALAKGLSDGLIAFLSGDRCGVPVETPTPTATPGQ